MRDPSSDLTQVLSPWCSVGVSYSEHRMIPSKGEAGRTKSREASEAISGALGLSFSSLSSLSFLPPSCLSSLDFSNSFNHCECRNDVILLVFHWIESWTVVRI